MSAHASLRQPLPQMPDSPAAAVTVEEALGVQADASHSPALQLQNMLVERLNVIEETALKTDKYDVRLRLAVIVGISAFGWGLVLLAARGVVALFAG